MTMCLLWGLNFRNEDRVKKEKMKKQKAEQQQILKIKNSLSKDFILGKFDYQKDTNFVKVSPQHSSKTIYLNKKVYEAFKKMHNEAQKSEINLIIVSGTRNFWEQKEIWERKLNLYSKLKPLQKAKKILEFSSMPTTSRHHWGTDIDLNNLENSYFETGEGKKIYDWLVENANKFGFYQVYTPKETGRKGYELESWHWSYLPLASIYLEFYNENIKYSDISGFRGSELAKDCKIISEFVNGISEQAKNF